VLIVALAVWLALPLATDGAPQTLGKTGDPNDNGCSPGAWVQLATGTGSPSYVAPSDGTITSWSYQAGANAGEEPFQPQLKLKIARPVSGSDFKIVGESALQTPIASLLNTFPTSIPVKQGDLLGLYLSAAGGCYRAASGYTLNSGAGDPAPGSTPTLGSTATQQLDVSARLLPTVTPPPPPPPPPPRRHLCDGLRATILAKPGKVTMGTDRADVIYGTPGHDVIFGGKGEDIICGRDGSDYIHGNRGEDLLKGGPGEDFLSGGDNEDVCRGGPDDDDYLGCEDED
jgi:Ca2+-binding RTX toxin-like protein